KVQKMHVHFSKIEYSKGGEVRHLTFEDDTFGPNFEPLASVLKMYKLEPYIICESAGTQTEDAIFMKNYYNNI
ncbi:MAG: endonuclease IV, partial [Clostridia bacterium]